ncbi:hypothetical protein GN956_G15667 [Arapaima gigas]
MSPGNADARGRVGVAGFRDSVHASAEQGSADVPGPSVPVPVEATSSDAQPKANGYYGQPKTEGSRWRSPENGLQSRCRDDHFNPAPLVQ